MDVTKILFWIALIYFSNAQLYGQGKNVMCKKYNTKLGLSSNVVSDVIQDQEGFLWIATQNGLNRFDGKNFTIFNHLHNDSNSIANNIITKIFVAQNSDVWIGYANDGVQCFNSRTKIRHVFNYKNGIPSTSVTSLFVDPGGIVWVGFHSNGLVRIDPNSRSVERININYHQRNSNTMNTIYDIYEGNDGILWLATHGGLFTYNKTTGDVSEYNYYSDLPLPTFRDDLFLSILPDGNKGLWLSSWGGGISYFDFTSKQFSTFKYDLIHPNLPTKNIVMGLVKMKESLWLATRDQGLLEFDVSAKKFKSVSFIVKNTEAKLLDIPLNVIFRDKSGQLWVGSDEGLFYVNTEAPHFNFKEIKVTHTDNLEFYKIRRVIEDTVNNKTILAVTFADGLNVIDNTTGQQRHYPILIHPANEPFQIVNDLLYQSKDSIWVVTRDYIQLFNPSTEIWLTVKQPPKNGYLMNYFLSIKRDNHGDLWFTTFQNGVFKFNPKTADYTHLSPKVLPSNSISDLEFDYAGNQFISSFDNGLVINLKSGKTLHIRESNHRDSIKSNLIRSMISDIKGNLWVCTADNGVFRISGKSLALGKIEIDNFIDIPCLNLPSFDIMEAYENIWIITVNGIVRFDPKSKRTEMFDNSHGLKPYFNSYRFSIEKNKLYLSTYGGYYSIDPVNLHQPKSDISLSINSFKVNGKEHFLNRDSSGYSTKLNYYENTISFDFTAIEFKTPQQARLLYRLKGVDKQWLDGQQRNVTYSNLQPGDYTFEIMADNIEEIERLTINFSIASPFWKTQWFYLFVCASIIILAWIIINNRLRSFMKEESLKNEFNRSLAESQLTAFQSQMNPHFIFNSLNAINRYIIKENKHNAVEYLGKFSRLIRSILENSVEKTVSLEKEIKTIELYLELESLRYDNKFSFEIVLDNSMDTDIEIPSMIIQPFLENSIWHGILHKEGHGFIKVEILRCDETFLKCIITDNGIGRERAAEIKSRSATKIKSYGIGISRERLRIINGNFQSHDFIKITDLHDIYGEPEGTRVEIKLKFSYSHDKIKSENNNFNIAG